MTSLPDRMWYVGQESVPSAHTHPARLLQSGANVATGAIQAGQSQQLLPQQ